MTALVRVLSHAFQNNGEVDSLQIVGLFSAAGLFLLIAAFTANAHKAKGIDATLRAFTKTPAGPWLLVLVAIGLVLFGCYSWAESRWRKV